MTNNSSTSLDLISRIQAMNKIAVMVVGDLMLDEFVYGDVNRISPESPVPVLSKTRDNRMMGGAGNVISNLIGLQVKTFAAGVVGADLSGQLLKGMAASKIENHDGLIEDETRPTTIKTRFLSGTHQLLRVDFEKTTPVNTSIEDRLIAYVQNNISKVGSVILSDYGKGVLTQTVITKVIECAKAHQVPVLVDPKGKDYTIYKGASVATPNRKELSEASGGMPTREDSDVVVAAQTIIERTGIEALVATRSQDGMTIVQKSAQGQFVQPVHLRTEALEVFDVSGAGDTVIATIAAALAAGANLVEAAALANIAGGLVVAKVGTTPVRQSEIIDFLQKRDRPLQAKPEGDRATFDTTRHPRICDWQQALEQVERWQARGLKVGFTNGCFDVLHFGHVTYLNQARDKCDRLIVGLNADASVSRLKGSGRPVHHEQARCAVIGALGSVDMVVVFGNDPAEDDKPTTLIGKLQPDIFFKGGDYTIDQLPEAKTILAYGGEIAIMSMFEGHSTTSSIEKIKQNDSSKAA